MSNRIRIKDAESFEREVRPPELETVTVFPDVRIDVWGVERRSWDYDPTGQGEYDERDIVRVYKDKDEAKREAERLQAEQGFVRDRLSGTEFYSDQLGEAYRLVGPIALKACIVGEPELID